MSETEMRPGQLFARDSVLDALRDYIASKGTQKAAAEELGVSPQYLGDVMKGRREPAGKILAKIGIRRIVYFTYAKTDEGKELRRRHDSE